MTEAISSLKPDSFRLVSTSGSGKAQQGAEECALAPGQVLCRAGDRKSAVWRLESGILYVTAPPTSAPNPSDPPDIVELAFPGAILGLGFLEQHAHNITALVPSRVTVWPREVLEDLSQIAPDAPERQQKAVEREFASRRRQLVNANRSSPLRRLAAFLIAMSGLNEAEGHDPERLSDKFQVDAVAVFLDVSLAELSNALSELRARNLIAPSGDGGLLLTDLKGLDTLASGGEAAEASDFWTAAKLETCS